MMSYNFGFATLAADLANASQYNGNLTEIDAKMNLSEENLSLTAVKSMFFLEGNTAIAGAVSDYNKVKDGKQASIEDQQTRQRLEFPDF